MLNRELEGQWSLPDGELPVGGRLTFSADDGARLVTVGALTSDYVTSSETVQPPVIWGLVMSPDFVSHVTLLNSFRQTHRTQGALVRQHFAPELVLLGAHVRETDPFVTKCVIQFTQLDPWLDVSGFTEGGITDGEDGYTVKYSQISIPTMELEIGKVRRICLPALTL